jgi:hypothetical protein
MRPGFRPSRIVERGHFGVDEQCGSLSYGVLVVQGERRCRQNTLRNIRSIEPCCLSVERLQDRLGGELGKVVRIGGDVEVVADFCGNFLEDGRVSERFEDVPKGYWWGETIRAVSELVTTCTLIWS